MTPGSVEIILCKRIDSLDFPGAMENLCPPLPLPVATGFLFIHKCVSLVSVKSK